LATAATGIYSMLVCRALIEHGDFWQVLVRNAGHGKNVPAAKPPTRTGWCTCWNAGLLAGSLISPGGHQGRPRRVPLPHQTGHLRGCRLWSGRTLRVPTLSGALFKTPCDRKEEKRTGGIECVMVGGVRTAIVGVEHLPVLKVGYEPLDRCAKRRNLGVVFLVGQG